MCICMDQLLLHLFVFLDLWKTKTSLGLAWHLIECASLSMWRNKLKYTIGERGWWKPYVMFTLIFPSNKDLYFFYKNDIAVPCYFIKFSFLFILYSKAPGKRTYELQSMDESQNQYVSIGKSFSARHVYAKNCRLTSR